VAALLEPVQGAPHAAVLVQAVFVEECVESDVDPLEAALDPGEHRFFRLDLEALPGLVLQRVAVIRHQLACHIDQIPALVPVFGQRDVAAQRLQIARPQAMAEHAHLATGVVEVVLELDLVPESAQQVRHGAADNPVARVADRQRAGGVGAHTFDLGPLAAPDVQRKHGVPGGDDRLDLVQDPRIGQANVDETGRGGLDAVDEPGRGSVARDGLRDVQRFAVGNLGKLHGDRAGEVAQLRFGAALDRNGFGRVERGQITGCLGALNGVAQQGGEVRRYQVHEQHSSAGQAVGCENIAPL